MKFPEFRYHPDPITTGSIKPSASICECCGKERGFIYTGPVYSRNELRNSICPWCIKNGKAHEKFSAVFCDISGIGGYGRWETVPQEVKELISYRTPGFSGWQQEQWWTHCRDGAEFLGPFGYDGLINFGSEIVFYLRNEMGITDEPFWQKYLRSLDKDYGPTAFIFRCLHCGTLGGYSDWH